VLVRRYHARWVVPVSQPPIGDGTVAVEDGRIAYVGPRSGAPGGEEVELGSAVLMPGLVNTHTHLELTAMRGLLEGLSFVPWVRTLTQMRAAVLDDAAMADAARVGLAEGLLAGITTYADTSSSGVTLGAMRDAGVRGIMYQEVFGPAAEQHDAALAGLAAAIQRHRPLETDLVSVGVSPHAPYTVHDDLMVDTAAYSLRERLPMAIHLAESAEEIAFLREGEGPFADLLRARGIPVVRRSHSPVHWLVEMGVLVAQPLLIHCVRVDPTDISFIADAGCAVAHCPASNAKFGHGVAPVRAMLDAGIRVGLGSDSVASNNQMDLLGEARLAALLQNAVGGRSDVLSAEQALALATIGGARALGLADRIGTLDVGKAADLAAFPLDGARAVPTTDPVAAAVYALPGTVARLVCVAGRELVRDGRIVTQIDAGAAVRVEKSAAAMAAWRKGR
jgi:cytosine/adenosine deaminase-related metal-dependent hydrolase